MVRHHRTLTLLLPLLSALPVFAQHGIEDMPGYQAQVAVRGAAALPRPEPPNFDEILLRRRGIGTEPAALISVLREFNRPAVDAKRLEKLIQQFGHENFERREEASRAVAALGLPALRRLAEVRDDDLEVRRRAMLAAEEIRTVYNPDVALAAVRELIRQRADGAAAALLGYLPLADADIEHEIYFGIDRVSIRDGKFDPALRTALTDPSPERRALAALVLGRLGGDEFRKAVRTSLADAEPIVRLRAAQGLLAAKDDAALPALVNLLDGVAIDLSWQAEELLRWIAGPSAPKQRVGKGDATERVACRKAWQSWLSDHGRVDWERVGRDHRRPGLILVASDSAVALLGCDGKPAWSLKVDDLHISDAHLLPGGRLLLAGEGDISRVVETDLSGKTMWELCSNGEQFRTCQHLADGNTFIVSDERLLVVTPSKQETFSLALADANVNDAVKRRNAPILCLYYTKLRAFDEHSGVELWCQNLDGCSRGLLFPLPDGSFLVNRYNRNKVLHCDREGCPIWERPMTRLPTCVSGLPNGNVVVATAQVGPRIVELTRTGQTVWEAPVTGQVRRIRPCFNLLRVGLDHPRPADLDLDSAKHGPEKKMEPAK